MLCQSGRVPCGRADPPEPIDEPNDPVELTELHPPDEGPRRKVYFAASSAG